MTTAALALSPGRAGAVLERVDTAQSTWGEAATARDVSSEAPPRAAFARLRGVLLVVVVVVVRGRLWEEEREELVVVEKRAPLAVLGRALPGELLLLFFTPSNLFTPEALPASCPVQVRPSRAFRSTSWASWWGAGMLSMEAAGVGDFWGLLPPFKELTPRLPTPASSIPPPPPIPGGGGT